MDLIYSENWMCDVVIVLSCNSAVGSELDVAHLQVEAWDQDCSPQYSQICNYEIVTAGTPFAIDRNGKSVIVSVCVNLAWQNERLDYNYNSW